MNKRSHLNLLAVITIVLATVNLSFAQEPQPTPIASSRNINMSLIVVDASDHSVDDVQKDEVRLLENDSPQVISSFSKADKAVDYGIAIDTSGSVRPIFSPLIGAVRAFLEHHRSEDECFIERFISSDKIEVVQEFTSDKAMLLKPLSSLYIEGGQSAVIDAIYIAVKHIAERPANPQRRRALVLFSDGDDRASYYTHEQLMQLLRSTDVQIFVIGLIEQLNSQSGLTVQSQQKRARDLLKSVARETGGRVFFPRKYGELSEALGEIFHDLHTQYDLSYQSTDASKENFHRVAIEVIESVTRKKVAVINRPGYYLTPPEIETKDKKKKPKQP